jgi:hypothetical protein
MGEGNWLRRGTRRTKAIKKAHRKGYKSNVDSSRSRLSFESLEDRQMLTTFVVNTLSDIDTANNVVFFGSLRWAIGQANATDAADTIVFDQNLFLNDGTPFRNGGAANIINLSNHALGGELAITKPLTILGPGPGELEISQGKPNNRIFNINNGDDDVAMPVEISGVTLSGGNLVGVADEKRGGAILNREALTMTEDIITDNSAGNAGGGIYVAIGRLTLDRSLLTSNSAGVGGAIMTGSEDDMHRPSTLITNSTFYGNSAFGVPDKYDAFGGAIFNRNGRLEIQSSTITNNFGAMDGGAGVASYGNPVPDDPMSDPPPPTVFTYIGSSIIWGNMDSDVDRVGETDDDPPVPLMPSVFGADNMPGSLGFNMIGTGNTTVAGDDQAFKNKTKGDQVNVDPKFYMDPDTMLILNDYGGSTPTILLDDGSTAIDAGDPDADGDYEQRGRQFARIADNPYNPDGMAVIDIGASEAQNATFVVDTILDGQNRSFMRTYAIDVPFVTPTVFPNFDAYDDSPGTLFSVPLNQGKRHLYGGDFSLREAITFATWNPGADTILFSEDFNQPDYLIVEDKNDTVAPTIILNRGSVATPSLNLGPLLIDEDLTIIGPSTFTLEIDASGSDPNPTLPTGGGTRLFYINDNDSTVQSHVSISNLTFMGADFNGVGAAVLTTEDLALVNMTLKNNRAAANGAALYIQGGGTTPVHVTIDSSTFNNNRSDLDGGGIYAVSGAVVDIINSTFSSNSAGNRGAAIANSNSQVTVNFSTFTLNNATSTFGSGINNSGSFAVTKVSGSIISGNVNKDVDVSGGATAASFISLGYNFIGKGGALSAFSAATHDITNNTNPMLEPLLNTGGIVATHRPVYRPTDGLISPVIDAGDPAAMAGAGGVPDLDQRNLDLFTRVFDVTGVGATTGARIDIGSYELQGAVFTVDTSTDELDGDFSTGRFSLREAINLANQNPLPDTITFDLASIGGTINLSGTTIRPVGTPLDLQITTPMTITLSDVDLMNGFTLVIDGSSLFTTTSTSFNYSRMFTINDNNSSSLIDVTLRGFEFDNGTEDDAGGTIWSSENLTLDSDSFYQSRTVDVVEQSGLPSVDLHGLHGGAVYQQGATGFPRPTLTITNSLFSGNSTDDLDADGGAIYVLNSNVLMSNTALSGNATKEGSSEGGAIVVKNSAFTSDGDIFTGNIVGAGASNGGAIYSDNSIVLLSNGVLSGNQTNGTNSRGGALSALNSSVTLNDMVVSGNHTFGNASSGGGVAMQLDTSVLPTAQSSLTVNRSIVNLNAASGGSVLGGGIYINGGSALVNETTVSENTVSGGGSNGAGIATVNGNLIVRDSTINANVASDSQSKGGGIYTDTNLAGTQSTQIINSTISGNIAKLRGGGVFNADGLTEIKHSTIANNDIPATIPPNSVVGDFDGDNDVDGADFLIWQRNLGRVNAGQNQGDANHDGVVNGADLTQIKINFGTAAGSVVNAGSGVASQGNASTRTTILSSIVAGNKGAGTGTDVDAVEGGVNSFQSQGYNVIGRGNAISVFTATNDLSGVLDPRLAPLADNGVAPNITFDLLTHALLPDSPAINHGSPSFNPNSFSPTLTTDERGTGFARVQAGRIDAGAFESPFFPTVAASQSAALAAEQPATSAALTAAEEASDAPTAQAPSTSSTSSFDSSSESRFSIVSLGTPSYSAATSSPSSAKLAPSVDALPWDQALASYAPRVALVSDSQSAGEDELATLAESNEADAASPEDDAFAILAFEGLV